MKQEEMSFLYDLKALMEHAIFHQESETKLDMRLAINHAHQAVEITLRKKAEHLGKAPYDFPKIISALKNKNVKIPYQRQIEELNKARVLTQHYGTTPNEKDARRLIFVARDFLIDFWKEAFEVDYERVSLFALITNKDVKKALQEAQEYFEKNKNYREATIKSILAIYETKWWIKSKFPICARAHTLSFDTHSLERAVDQILEITLSGPYAHRLRKFREYTGVIFLPIPGGDAVFQQMKECEFTRKDALFALQLATEYALWAEQVYG